MADQRRGGIAWTDFTVNPIRARDRKTAKVGHWCEKISPVSHRDQVEVYFEPKVLDEVLRRRIPTRWFWCDMSDLFGAWVPDEWIYRCLAVMALTPQHTHQLLTKRADRLRDFFQKGWESIYYGFEDTPEYRRVEHDSNSGNKEWSQEAADRVSDARRAMTGDPLLNIWCGVSVEDRKHLDRLDLLRQTPAAVRFVSCEPLLEDLGDVDLAGIDQAIYGGESGPSARPCDLAWIRRGVASCRKSGTAVFVKQLGSRPIYDLGDGHRDEARTRPVPLRDRAGADPFEWPEDLRDARAFPRGPA